MRFQDPARPVVDNDFASSGADEALQGLSSDPWNASIPSGPGLRVPQFNPASTNPGAGAAQYRYLFLLATRQVQRRCRIVGLGQMLTIGANAISGEGSTQSRPIELFVTTPTFRFPDGNVSWHLVIEPNVRNTVTRPTTDAANFAFQEADGPSLLYNSCAFSTDFVNPLTGAPIGGYAATGAMTGYTPPAIPPLQWRPIGGLGCFYDLRYQWNASSVWNPNLDIPVDSNCRVSFYASVLQTAGQAHANTTIPSNAYLPPEESFIYAGGTGWSGGVFYWRIGGRVIFEDDLTAGFDCEDFGSRRGAPPQGPGVAGRTPKGAPTQTPRRSR